MAVQARTNNNNLAFIRQALPISLVKEAEVVKQNALRTDPMVAGTVMAQIGATRKWVPLTDIAAVDGSALPAGVLMQDIPAAQIVAGDVSNVSILIGCAILNGGMIVFENSLTKDTVVTASSLAVTVEAVLAWKNIYLENVVNIDEFEN